MSHINKDEYNELIEDLKRKINYGGTDKLEIWRNGKLIISGNNDYDLRKNIIKHIEKPEKDRKVFVIGYMINDINNIKKYVLSISVNRLTITPDLELVQKDDDIRLGKVVKYSFDELKKYGFKESHIKKIIKAIENKKISLNPLSLINIRSILKLKY